MRRLYVLLIALIAVPLLSAAVRSPTATPVASPPPWCRPTDDAFAQRFLARMMKLATSNDSDWVATRRAWDDMPQVDPSAVWLVTDDSLCQRASMALDSSYFTTPHGYPLYLAHLGSRYVAFPPSESNVGFWVQMDSTFRVLSAAMN